MGKKIWQTPVQRRYTNSKEAHEKMVHIYVIREMNIKTTVKHQHTPSRMAKILTFDNTKHWFGCESTESFIYCWGELIFIHCKMVQPPWKDGLKSSLKNTLWYELQIALLGIYPKNLKTYVHIKNMNSNI